MLNDTVVTSLEEKRGTRLPTLWREAFTVGNQPLVVTACLRTAVNIDRWRPRGGHIASRTRH